MRTFDVSLRTRSQGPWRTFSHPVAIFEALEPGDVLACLAAVANAVEQGAYAAGFLTYESAAGLGYPTSRRRTGSLPLVAFGIYPAEHVTSIARASAREPYRLGEWRPATSREACASARGRIEAGGIGPVTCTLRLHAGFEGEPRALMADLDAAQGGRMSAFVDTGTHVICATSPELLFGVDGSIVECRPVTGRWPRGLSAAADRAHARRLEDAGSIRAHHAAVVDLARSGLSRLSSEDVQVEAPVVERSSLHWQLASSVRTRVGRASLADLVAALFPSGSVTGPQRADAMALVKAVEPGPRGVHTGAIGYVSPHGRGLVSVVRRSIVINRNERQAELSMEALAASAAGDEDGYDACLAEAAVLIPPAAADARSPNTRIVSYATAARPGFRLLETIGWTPEEGFTQLDRHLARLAGSAGCFGFECDAAEVRTVLDAAVEDLAGRARLRLLLGRDGAITCEAVDLEPAGTARLRVAFAAEPIDQHDVFLYHKTTRRGACDRARASRPDVDAVLLWNAGGELTEATGWNVVVDVEGRKVTPALDCGLLPGTLRAELLARGDIVEERVPRDAVRAAGRLWLINSLHGWVEATLVE